MIQKQTFDGCLTGKRYKPYQTFAFRVTVPCVEAESFGLLVEHDGENTANVDSMLQLAGEGKAPYCVTVGISPGVMAMPDGTERNMRMNDYDLFDREYGDFVVYELIPYLTERYGLRISESPDLHMVSGGSSGGISAFVMAWFHPEYFHRVYMSSPSFLAMGRGNEIPYLVRKYETKPLRIYQEWSENEPDDYFGWSRGVDEVAKAAFLFAGYDFAWKFFPEEGHCSRYRDQGEAYERNRWLWQDWQTKPVTKERNSSRVDKIVPPMTCWEPCDTFPAPPCDRVPEVLLASYQTAVLSNDGQLWYVGNPLDDGVYAYRNDGDILPEKRIFHATLHTLPRSDRRGVLHMAVDRTDRLLVLTEMGIQCVRSYGLIDAILDLPDDSAPVEVAVADALYVRTEKGVYKRPLCDDCVTESPVKRKQISYYD